MCLYIIIYGEHLVVSRQKLVIVLGSMFHLKVYFTVSYLLYHVYVTITKIAIIFDWTFISSHVYS